ncbi:MAG: CoA transferase [Chloroflexi bacterium]|nr:CoA transferase [Chloroflexota bacterium]MYD48868.1 CoA transferase [Chloroflexota bacterium]
MRPSESTLLPEQFGPLQGMRILSTGTIVAEPVAAGMAAEMGAEVIHVERPGAGEDWRVAEFPIEGPDGNLVASSWLQDHRNMYHTTLDFSTAEGREIFLQLAHWANVWMESSKARTYDKWGLDDDTVLAANPAIVICHVSGYGQDGDPEYVARASYDFTAQAFGGMMNLVGNPEPDPPTRAVPWTADYITALFCLWSSLAAYIHAQRTGQGQVIDLAQFEAVHRILSGTMVAYHELGLVRERAGNKAGNAQPWDTFQAKDGWVVIAAVGPVVYGRVCRVLDLDPDEEKWVKARREVNSPEGIEFDAVLRGWVEDRTVDEVVRIFSEAQVGCSRIMNAREMAENSHYQARGVHVQWEDQQLGKPVTGVGIVPRFSETPGKIWRGSVPVGHDNELIYGNLLGITPQTLDKLTARGVI